MSNACLHRIVIEPTTIRGDQGQYYRVRYEDEVLIEETWNPELEACRALIARGITGRMEVWRAGKAHADIIVPSIEEAARWSVVENDKERALSLSYGSRCPRTFSEMPFPAVGGFRQRLILCLGYPVPTPRGRGQKTAPTDRSPDGSHYLEKSQCPRASPPQSLTCRSASSPCVVVERDAAAIVSAARSTTAAVATTAASRPAPRRPKVASA